jgi:hypothetical protein
MEIGPNLVIIVREIHTRENYSMSSYDPCAALFSGTASRVRLCRHQGRMGSDHKPNVSRTRTDSGVDFSNRTACHSALSSRSSAKLSPLFTTANVDVRLSIPRLDNRITTYNPEHVANDYNDASAGNRPGIPAA